LAETLSSGFSPAGFFDFAAGGGCFFAAACKSGVA
jgi:hypothetical protein